MKTGITLQSLYDEVRRQQKAKRDMLISTDVGARMVVVDEGDAKRLVIETLPSGAAHLERFGINETAHRQVSEWLGIPWRYYDRLVHDHSDLVAHQVNALFQREPGRRMFRILDGRVRAFLSDKYRRIDNDTILAGTLPAILDQSSGVPANAVIRSHITDDSMSFTTVFTGDELAQQVGVTHDGKADIVRPGFIVSNSETGKGTFHVKGFFHRGYCTNGCVWFSGDFTVELRRNHLGGRLASGLAGEILSAEAQQADDRALILAARDVMKAMGTKAMADRLGDALRAAKGSEPIKQVSAATELLAAEVGLMDGEVEAFLDNLIAEADLSRYGALNAVTAIANSDETTQERAFELEDIGGKILAMNNDAWLKIANAKVAV